MKKSLVFSENSFVQLMEHLDYPESGLSNQVVWHGAQCQYNLLCLAAQAKIPEHTSPQNATVQVIEGTGELTLNGQVIVLEPGVFIFMPANAPHTLAAASNLAFLLTRSAVG